MQKIPTLFKRDPEDMRRLTTEVDPRCQWVINGEGTPTRKYDGTCVMLDDSERWWARREVKPGKKAPQGFLVIEFDVNTGKTVGWEPIDQSPFVKMWQEAVHLRHLGNITQPGTYELCGPKINNNPEQFSTHVLVPHGIWVLDAPRTYPELQTWLLAHDYEGVVWHHDDGRMAKIKRRDFNA